MSGWIKDPKNNPPPEFVVVEVLGNDFMGNWTSKAMRKDYKPGSTKKQLKRKWRWCNEDGSKFEDQAIEAWRHLE